MTFIIGWLIALQLQSIDFHTNWLLWIITSLLWFNFKHRIATSLPTSTRNTHLIHQEPAIRGKKQWKYYNERKNKKKEAKIGMEETMLYPPSPAFVPTLLPTIDRFRSSGVSLENQATASRKIYDFSKRRRKGMEEDGGGRRGRDWGKLEEGMIPRGEEPILGKVKRTCIYNNKKKCISTGSQHSILNVCSELIYMYRCIIMISEKKVEEVL